MAAEKIDLVAVLKLHADWLRGVAGGVRADLRGSDLRGSNLRGSNLRGSDLRGSDLRGSDLRDSDLRGSDLSSSNLRGSNLSSSDLRDSNLRGSDLRGSNLSGSNLRGSDLRDSNLRDSDLRGSDLRDSDLRGSELSGSNLSGSKNLPPVEAMPDIRARVVAAVEGGKLDMDNWHSECGTTHCLAGWTNTIHPQGRLLESLVGPGVAAALILHAAGETIPNFYGTNEEAMAWLNAKAGSHQDKP